MDGIQAVDFLKSHRDCVDIMRVDFYCAASTARLFSGDKCRAAARERVQDEPTTFRTIQNGVRYQGHWFNRRVQGKLGIAVLPERVDACVSPKICAAATEAA